jgi:hypothetical protein
MFFTFLFQSHFPVEAALVPAGRAGGHQAIDRADAFWLDAAEAGTGLTS